MTTPIQHRATELVEKSGMPWHEAENLALSEFGITDADVEELMGECCNTTILTGEDISALIRSVLVHGSALLARNSEDAMTSSAYIDGLERRTHEMKKKIDALDFDLRTARLASASKPKQEQAREGEVVAPSAILARGRFHFFKGEDGEPDDWEWFEEGTNCEHGCIDAVIVRADAITAPQPVQPSEPAQPEQGELTGCACRWDADDNRVATCVRHQGWLDVVHEWAERAKSAETTLQSAQQSPPVG